jgi:hypothetical protein
MGDIQATLRMERWGDEEAVRLGYTRRYAEAELSTQGMRQAGRASQFKGRTGARM